MEHLPQCAKEDLIAGAHVCRSVWRADVYQAREGFWRYEGHFQVAVKMCFFHMVNSFSVCVHLDIAIEHTYNEDGRSRSHMAE